MEQPALLLNELAFVLLYVIASLFPDGRFVPRWTRWLIVGYIGIEVWRISMLLAYHAGLASLPALGRVRYLALSLVGHRCHHQSNPGLWLTEHSIGLDLLWLRVRTAIVFSCTDRASIIVSTDHRSLDACRGCSLPTITSSTSASN